MQAGTNKSAGNPALIIDAHAHIFPNKIAEKAVAGIPLTCREREMILYENAKNLLKL